MAIAEAFASSATITTTERWLAADSTTQGSGQSTPGAYQLVLDLSALANGDEFRIRVYDKARSADTVRIGMEWTVSHAQSEPLYFTPTLMLFHAWDFSLTKLAGTDRAIPWSIRAVT